MLRMVWAATLAVLVAACAATTSTERRDDRAPFDHIVVLFLETQAG